jgi:hypothetical protein
MNLGRPLPALQLDGEQRQQLEAMASSRSLLHGLVPECALSCSAPRACPIGTSPPACD